MISLLDRQGIYEKKIISFGPLLMDIHLRTPRYTHIHLKRVIQKAFLIWGILFHIGQSINFLAIGLHVIVFFTPPFRRTRIPGTFTVELPHRRGPCASDKELQFLSVIGLWEKKELNWLPYSGRTPPFTSGPDDTRCGYVPRCMRSAIAPHFSHIHT